MVDNASHGREAFLTLIHQAGVISQLPKWNKAEFAYCGSSNVGKSSLLNALGKSRKRHARVSKSPGCTKTINFYHANKNSVIADLPGHGYANTTQSDRQRINTLLAGYFSTRSQLQRAFFIIDARLGFKGDDQKWLEFMNKHGVATTLVVNKCDKLPERVLTKKKQELMEIIGKYPQMYPEPLLLSAKTGTGITGLLAELST